MFFRLDDIFSPQNDFGQVLKSRLWRRAWICCVPPLVAFVISWPETRRRMGWTAVDGRLIKRRVNGWADVVRCCCCCCCCCCCWCCCCGGGGGGGCGDGMNYERQWHFHFHDFSQLLASIFNSQWVQKWCIYKINRILNFIFTVYICILYSPN